MHSFVLGKKDGLVIDHVDGDGLNNQRENLQFCTSAQNSYKKRKYKNGSSAYRGVTKKNNKNWIARIQVNGNAINIGSFPLTHDGEKEAAKAYNIAATKYYGDFANLNNIENPATGIVHAPKQHYNKNFRDDIIAPKTTIGAMSIPLTNGLFAIVDEEDYEGLNQHKWLSASSLYAKRSLKRVANKPRQYEYMHKIIMGASKGQIVDHINGNPLDNRRSNLRICNAKQSSANTKKRITNNRIPASIYRGVYKVNSRWVARYNRKHLGCFPPTKEGEVLAAKKFNEAIFEKFGEFAKLNPI